MGAKMAAVKRTSKSAIGMIGHRRAAVAMLLPGRTNTALPNIPLSVFDPGIDQSVCDIDD